jgi:hypothetical protein
MVVQPAPRAVVDEPWMAQPPPAAVPSGEPWQSPIAQSKGPALEPIDLPPAIEQGVDMIYIDESLVPKAVHRGGGFLAGMQDAAWSAAPVDLFTSVNPIYTDLRRGLIKYEQNWGSLPQIQIPSGPTLKAGSTGDRVTMLRTRLGLPEGDSYDSALAARVKDFQAVHGLKDDGIAGSGTIEALNRGADYYEQLIIINMERAKRLPAPEEQSKYVICGGAFAGLEKIISDRMQGKSMGFGAHVVAPDERKTGEILQHCEPEDLLKFGLIPEFVGRLPVIATLLDLDETALVKILVEPKNALVKQYAKLFDMEDVQLEFTDDALHSIAVKAIERKTGARGLRSILEGILLDTMFDLPSMDGVDEVHIDKEVVLGTKEPVRVYAAKDKADDAA